MDKSLKVLLPFFLTNEDFCCLVFSFSLPSGSAIHTQCILDGLSSWRVDPRSPSDSQFMMATLSCDDTVSLQHHKYMYLSLTQSAAPIRLSDPSVQLFIHLNLLLIH